MYFPYLRGKQFELIALREISDILSDNDTKVSPIIEPVKDSPTLRKTLTELSREHVNFNIVVNPGVGDLSGSPDSILDILKAGELSSYSNYQAAILIDGSHSAAYYAGLAGKLPTIACGGVTLIHNAVHNDIAAILAAISTASGLPVVYNVINSSKTNRRYYRSFDPATLVSLDDFFCCQQKNADYLPIDESQFSEEHLFFGQDGYKGFSDFLTVGEAFSEGGFLPFAVAIHLSYADSSGAVRVKHFVSDSNMDTADIGGKFEEALTKLVRWCRPSSLRTRATEQFFDLHNNGHFPGLGSIKKLSVMNHIELVLSLI